MKLVKKDIIVNYINVGGIFSIREDTLFKIGKPLEEFICDKNSSLLKYFEYCLFNNEKPVIDNSATVPNVQLDLSVGEKELHIIRLPGYVRENADGTKTLIKELLSYKYGDIDCPAISDKKFESFILNELGLSK